MSTCGIPAPELRRSHRAERPVPLDPVGPVVKAGGENRGPLYSKKKLKLKEPQQQHADARCRSDGEPLDLRRGAGGSLPAQLRSAPGNCSSNSPLGGSRRGGAQ
ncbi:hypothetical protein EYF80_066000 [Liparis tanakae]|uniref:Uncharacterized protein n=1 Tax=Liparis tanakae TaxID=230148 RepID=A0A4Z2E545_9TELE|nr:hypothetical protein EYF80_066000 [Liparis tanakae]